MPDLRKLAQEAKENVEKAVKDGWNPAEAAKEVKEKAVDLVEIAKEVIQGKWGNGEERVKKLTEAGFDAEAVQKKVNELMK